MYEQHRSFELGTWHLSEEFEATNVCTLVVSALKLAPGPKYGLFGCRVESFGVEQCAVVVVAEDREGKLHCSVQTLTGLWAVTYDVAEANNIVDPLRCDIFQHGFQCRQVPMNITENRSLRHYHTRRLIILRSLVSSAASIVGIGMVRNPSRKPELSPEMNRMVPTFPQSSRS